MRPYTVALARPRKNSLSACGGDDFGIGRPERVAEGAGLHTSRHPPIHPAAATRDQPAFVDARLEHRLSTVRVAADAAFLLDRQRQQRGVLAQVAIIMNVRLDHPGLQLVHLIRAETARRQEHHLRPFRGRGGRWRLRRGGRCGVFSSSIRSLTRALGPGTRIQLARNMTSWR